MTIECETCNFRYANGYGSCPAHPESHNEPVRESWEEEWGPDSEWMLPMFDPSVPIKEKKNALRTVISKAREEERTTTLDQVEEWVEKEAFDVWDPEDDIVDHVLRMEALLAHLSSLRK